MAIGNNILQGQLVWLKHLWDIQDQEGCIFETLYSLKKYWVWLKLCTGLSILESINWLDQVLAISNCHFKRTIDNKVIKKIIVW